VKPLDAGAELDGREYDPVPVGRSWTYRDNTGARYRRIIVRGMIVLGKNAPHPIAGVRTSEVYALEGDAVRPLERAVLDAESPEGVAMIGLVEADTGRPPMVPKDPAVEMPRHIRPGLAWNGGAVPARVLGLADVTVAAGDFPGCLVIEETGGFALKAAPRPT